MITGCMFVGMLSVLLAMAIEMPPSKGLYAAIYFTVAVSAFQALSPLTYRAEIALRTRLREELRRAVPELTEAQAAFVESGARRQPMVVDALAVVPGEILVEAPLQLLAEEAQKRFIAMIIGSDFREQSRELHRDGVIAREIVRVRGRSQETFVFDVTASVHDPLRLYPGRCSGPENSSHLDRKSHCRRGSAPSTSRKRSSRRQRTASWGDPAAVRHFRDRVRAAERVQHPRRRACDADARSRRATGRTAHRRVTMAMRIRGKPVRNARWRCVKEANRSRVAECVRAEDRNHPALVARL